MKYALALLPFYLGCAAPQVEKPLPRLIVDIRSNLQFFPDEEEEVIIEPLDKIVEFLTQSFVQITQQHGQQVEGTIYFDNSNQSFDYSFQPLEFCDSTTNQR